MEEKNMKIVYTLTRGDTLHNIAKMFNTSVEQILKDNKHIDPMNMMSGQKLYIRITNAGLSDSFLELSNEMRLAWSQHVMWTRSYLISVIDNLNDKEPVVNRLLRNPKDFAGIYNKYYSDEVAKAVDDLLTEHLTIAAGMLDALVNNDMAEFNRLDREWYRNADDIAKAFHSFNPYYEYEEIRRLMRIHLDLLKQEISYRYNKMYDKEVRIFDDVERHALMMADAFTKGIVEQFPDKF
jgi:LysM repeat protein